MCCASEISLQERKNLKFAPFLLISEGFIEMLRNENLVNLIDSELQQLPKRLIVVDNIDINEII
jgi:hypothetical protein